MKVYKAYVYTEKKDGTVKQSDYEVCKAENPEQAIENAIRKAKWNGMMGKVLVSGVWVKKDQPEGSHKVEWIKV